MFPQTVTPTTLTPSATVANRAYDGTTNATISTRSLTGVIAPDDVNLGTSGVASFGDKDVGTAKPVTVTALALTGSTAGNYILSTNGLSTTADITKKVLTVTASNATRVYSAPDPVFTNTYSGFVTGETAVSVLTGSPALSTTAIQSSPPAGYPITVTQGTLSAQNYSFTFVAGTLNITAASATQVFTSSPNPSSLGGAVTFTTTLSAVAPATAVPSGAVVFVTNGVSFANVIVTAGVASASTTSLAAGTNTVAARYACLDGTFLAVTNTLQQVVQAGNTLAISYDAPTSKVRILWSGTDQLQGNTDLGTTNWVDIAGATSPYELTAPSGKKFFRLRQQP